MKIAYVTIQDLNNINLRSGVHVYMLSALRDAGLEVSTISNLRWPLFVKTYASIIKVVSQVFLNKNYLRDRNSLMLRSFGRQVASKLSYMEPDVVFSEGTLPLPYLSTNIPVVFWGDATFAAMREYYAKFSNLSGWAIRMNHFMERQALAKSSLAIYSSHWAANSAVQDYRAPPEKVKVVPFGANVEHKLNEDDIFGIVRKRSSQKCSLLFAGKDWHRKGGDIAVDVTRRLRARGIEAYLHVLGCEPENTEEDFIHGYGFVSKADQRGHELFTKLFKEAHFLLLPTKADCVPRVFAEASSYGLPSITTNVGGIESAVNEGINGYLVNPSSEPDVSGSFCDIIEDLWLDKESYVELCVSSFREYKNRLSWDAAGKRVASLLKHYLA